MRSKHMLSHSPVACLLMYSSTTAFFVGQYFLVLFKNTYRANFLGFNLFRLAVLTVPHQLKVRSGRAAVARTIKYEIATMPKMLYVFFLWIHHCNSLNLSFLLVGNSGAFT